MVCYCIGDDDGDVMKVMRMMSRRRIYMRMRMMAMMMMMAICWNESNGNSWTIMDVTSDVPLTTLSQSSFRSAKSGPSELYPCQSSERLTASDSGSGMAPECSERRRGGICGGPLAASPSPSAARGLGVH